MNDKLSKLIIFAAGAAIGSAITWKVVKTRYEQIVEELENDVEYLVGREKDDKEGTDEESEEPAREVVRSAYEKPNLKEYAKKLEELKYNEEEDGEIMGDRPYVISPEEFGDLDDHETVTLYYYADGVLIPDDPNAEPLTDEEIDEFVGKDSLNHFGEYEDDSVFVRNNTTKGDYEILRVEDNYSDISPDKED